MARLRLEQIISNLSYNESNDQLSISPIGSDWENNTSVWSTSGTVWDVSSKSTFDLVVYGSVYVTSSSPSSGSLTINGVDTFGDSGSFYTMDLGSY